MKILLICTHNACRSIIGEAVINQLAQNETNLPPRIIAKSGGSSPRGDVHPLTLKHLKRRGYDISNCRSQSWDDFAAFEPDVVISLCDQAANEVCPVYFDDSLKINWGLADPSKDCKNEIENFDTLINILIKRTEKLLQQDFENMSREQLKILFEKIRDQK